MLKLEGVRALHGTYSLEIMAIVFNKEETQLPGIRDSTLREFNSWKLGTVKNLGGSLYVIQ